MLRVVTKEYFITVLKLRGSKGDVVLNVSVAVTKSHFFFCTRVL